jgi:hypothetical protein
LRARFFHICENLHYSLVSENHPSSRQSHNHDRLSRPIIVITGPKHTSISVCMIVSLLYKTIISCKLTVVSKPSSTAPRLTGWRAREKGRKNMRTNAFRHLEGAERPDESTANERVFPGGLAA